MARPSLSALPPFAGSVTGLLLGACAVLALPQPLGAALGLVLAGCGAIGSAALAERRHARSREQVLAAVGEVKVALAAASIRVNALSQRIDQMPMRESEAGPARATLNELTAEVGLLGDLLQQVAGTLADHESRIGELATGPSPAEAARPPAPVERGPPREDVAARLAAERLAAERLEAERIAEERAGVIGRALAEGRVEVFLQPVVQLPQRRSCGYEALVRLRLDETTLLTPEDFLLTIEARGFGPTLDALVLTRALAIARHLGAKESGLYVSCNFSRATWASSKALVALSRILAKYRDHVGRLVIEMPQEVFRALDPTSLGLLGAMSANGVRFALDQVTDLRFDPGALFDRGVRFVKVPAALLQAEAAGRSSMGIAAADLSTLLGRASILLVAEDLSDDPAVADMIELGVGFGQGTVFSPPRPVRPEVFGEPEPPAANAAPPQAPAPQPAPAAAAAVERLPLRAVLRRAG